MSSVNSAASSSARSAAAASGSTAATSGASAAASASASSGLSGGATNGSTPAIPGPSGLMVQSQLPVFTCVPASYNFTGGSPPYLLYIIRSGVPNAPVLKTLPAAAGPGTASWGCDLEPYTSFTFAILDSANRTEYSAPIIMQQSDNLACLPQPAQPPSAGAIAGAVVGGIAGLLLIGTAIWFAIIRPMRRANKRAKSESYGEVAERKSSAGGSVLKHGEDETGVAGSYNLANLNFTPSSLMALQEQRPAPPAYDDPTANPRAARRTRAEVTTGEDPIGYEESTRRRA